MTAARRGLLPLLAAVAVVAVVGGAVVLVRSGDGLIASGRPPVLHIAEPDTARDVAAGGVSGGRYVLRGDLPKGPDSASVRVLTATDESRVTALARALGLGPVQRDGANWVAVQGPARLRVSSRSGSPWTYVRNTSYASECLGGFELPDSPDGSVTSCAVVPAGPPAISPGDLAKAAAAARPILRLTSPSACPSACTPDHTPASAFASFSTQPTAGGRAVQGLTTTVLADGQGVVSATGWLGGTRVGSTYPLVSAKKAFASLGSGPQPMLACAPERPGSAADTPIICRSRVVVTGARLGYSYALDGLRALLVPAWLFDVEHSAQPVPVVAVDPAYLVAPDQSGSGGGSTGSGGTGGSTGPGGPPATGSPPESAMPLVPPLGR